MSTTQSYIQGKWTQGKGEAKPIFDSITGEHFTNINVDGFDIPKSWLTAVKKGKP